MAFLLGLVLGLAAGVATIIAFIRSENSRSKHRVEMAATVAAFSKMTVEDSRKILPTKYYPSWVVFAQQQKLNWLNLQLTKIWPYVDQAASEVIRTSVEPVLEQYRSAVLSSLKFSKLTLGTVAPQFTGVSILEEDDSGITMELEVQWDGNPNIVLDIQTALGVALPIQVYDIEGPLTWGWRNHSVGRTLTSVIYQDLRSSDSIDNPHSWSGWTLLWKIDVAPKILHFLWKFFIIGFQPKPICTIWELGLLILVLCVISYLRLSLTFSLSAGG